MPSIKSYFIKINKRKLTDPFNRILSFVITYHPAVKNLTQKMLERWSLMKIQPLLKTIYLKPAMISYKRVNFLKTHNSKG